MKASLQAGTVEPKRAQLLLVGITLAALLPFLNKAFHIDDPLFLWMADQIRKNPFDPYGFSINWSMSPKPFWQEMPNPPLCSYWIALVQSILGRSELALHCAFLIWPVLSIIAAFAIARRYCHEPFRAALLTLVSPVFLVSATNLMCDVMLMALYLWSIELWIRGLDQRRWLLLLASVIAASATAFTKYWGITVVPLMLAYTLVRERRVTIQLLLLALPLALLCVFQFWTKAKYGTGLLTDAFAVSRSDVKIKPNGIAQLMIGLAFAGGCFISALGYFPWKNWKLCLIGLGSVVLFIALFAWLVPFRDSYTADANGSVIKIEGGIFAAIGFAMMTVTILALIRDRELPTLLCAFWLLGIFVFATFFNWSFTSKTLLPAGPPAMILMSRWREGLSLAGTTLSRWVAPILLALISLWIVWADYRQANTARDAARQFRDEFRGELGTVWFGSHWGFQYYMQQWGAVPLNANGSQIYSGDPFIFPANNASLVSVPYEKLIFIRKAEFPTLPLVSTNGRRTGAGFYSSLRGTIPWAVDRVLPETYYVMRFK